MVGVQVTNVSYEGQTLILWPPFADKSFKSNTYTTFIHQPHNFLFQESITLEINGVKNDIRGCINNINKWVSDNYVEKNIVTLMDETFIHYDPLGVVLIMGAWNYPLMLSLGPIGTQEASFCHILITLLLILATKLRRFLSED